MSERNVREETQLAAATQIIRNHVGLSPAIARIIAHEIVTTLAQIDIDFITPRPAFVPKENRPNMAPERRRGAVGNNDLEDRINALTTRNRDNG